MGDAPGPAVPPRDGRIVQCACGQKNRASVARMDHARCGKCGAALSDAALTEALARAGLTFEQAEQQAQETVREYVAKYGDTAPTTLAFSAYKASRRDPESRDAIVFKLAQVILSEAT